MRWDAFVVLPEDYEALQEEVESGFAEYTAPPGERRSRYGAKELSRKGWKISLHRSEFLLLSYWLELTRNH